MTKADFIERAAQAAMIVSRKSGFPPGITVAQAALESAWGRSRLSRCANNYFGIKAHGRHEWVELSTTEIINGAAVLVAAQFARYGSMQECFEDRDALILKSKRYESARGYTAFPEKFLLALAGSWATDPQYAEKILRVYRSNNLESLDQVGFRDVQGTTSGANPQRASIPTRA